MATKTRIYKDYKYGNTNSVKEDNKDQNPILPVFVFGTTAYAFSKNKPKLFALIDKVFGFNKYDAEALSYDKSLNNVSTSIFDLIDKAFGFGKHNRINQTQSKMGQPEIDIFGKQNKFVGEIYNTAIAPINGSSVIRNETAMLNTRKRDIVQLENIVTQMDPQITYQAKKESLLTFLSKNPARDLMEVNRKTGSNYTYQQVLNDVNNNKNIDKYCDAFKENSKNYCDIYTSYLNRAETKSAVKASSGINFDLNREGSAIFSGVTTPDIVRSYNTINDLTNEYKNKDIANRVKKEISDFEKKLKSRLDFKMDEKRTIRCTIVPNSGGAGTGQLFKYGKDMNGHFFEVNIKVEVEVDGKSVHQLITKRFAMPDEFGLIHGKDGGIIPNTVKRSSTGKLISNSEQLFDSFLTDLNFKINTIVDGIYTGNLVSSTERANNYNTSRNLSTSPNFYPSGKIFTEKTLVDRVANQAYVKNKLSPEVEKDLNILDNAIKGSNRVAALDIEYYQVKGNKKLTQVAFEILDVERGTKERSYKFNKVKAVDLYNKADVNDYSDFVIFQREKMGQTSDQIDAFWKTLTNTNLSSKDDRTLLFKVSDIKTLFETMKEQIDKNGVSVFITKGNTDKAELLSFAKKHNIDASFLDNIQVINTDNLVKYISNILNQIQGTSDTLSSLAYTLADENMSGGSGTLKSEIKGAISNYYKEVAGLSNERANNPSFHNALVDAHTTRRLLEIATSVAGLQESLDIAKVGQSDLILKNIEAHKEFLTIQFAGRALPILGRAEKTGAFKIDMLANYLPFVENIKYGGQPYQLATSIVSYRASEIRNKKIFEYHNKGPMSKDLTKVYFRLHKEWDHMINHPYITHVNVDNVLNNYNEFEKFNVRRTLPTVEAFVHFSTRMPDDISYIHSSFKTKGTQLQRLGKSFNLGEYKNGIFTSKGGIELGDPLKKATTQFANIIDSVKNKYKKMGVSKTDVEIFAEANEVLKKVMRKNRSGYNFRGDFIYKEGNKQISSKAGEELLEASFTLDRGVAKINIVTGQQQVDDFFLTGLSKGSFVETTDDSEITDIFAKRNMTMITSGVKAATKDPTKWTRIYGDAIVGIGLTERRKLFVDMVNAEAKGDKTTANKLRNSIIEIDQKVESFHHKIDSTTFKKDGRILYGVEGIKKSSGSINPRTTNDLFKAFYEAFDVGGRGKDYVYTRNEAIDLVSKIFNSPLATKYADLDVDTVDNIQALLNLVDPEAKVFKSAADLQKEKIIDLKEKLINALVGKAKIFGVWLKNNKNILGVNTSLTLHEKKARGTGFGMRKAKISADTLIQTTIGMKGMFGLDASDFFKEVFHGYMDPRAISKTTNNLMLALYSLTGYSSSFDKAQQQIDTLISANKISAADFDSILESIKKIHGNSIVGYGGTIKEVSLDAATEKEFGNIKNILGGDKREGIHSLVDIEEYLRYKGFTGDVDQVIPTMSRDQFKEMLRRASKSGITENKLEKITNSIYGNKTEMRHKYMTIGAWDEINPSLAKEMGKLNQLSRFINNITGDMSAQNIDISNTGEYQLNYAFEKTFRANIGRTLSFNANQPMGLLGERQIPGAHLTLKRNLGLVSDMAQTLSAYGQSQNVDDVEKFNKLKTWTINKIESTEEVSNAKDLVYRLQNAKTEKEYNEVLSSMAIFNNRIDQSFVGIKGTKDKNFVDVLLASGHSEQDIEKIIAGRSQISDTYVLRFPIPGIGTTSDIHLFDASLLLNYDSKSNNLWTGDSFLAKLKGDVDADQAIAMFQSLKFTNEKQEAASALSNIINNFYMMTGGKFSIDYDSLPTSGDVYFDKNTRKITFNQTLSNDVVVDKITKIKKQLAAKQTNSVDLKLGMQTELGYETKFSLLKTMKALSGLQNDGTNSVEDLFNDANGVLNRILNGDLEGFKTYMENTKTNNDFDKITTKLSNEHLNSIMEHTLSYEGVRNSYGKFITGIAGAMQTKLQGNVSNLTSDDLTRAHFNVGAFLEREYTVATKRGGSAGKAENMVQKIINFYSGEHLKSNTLEDLIKEGENIPLDGVHFEDPAAGFTGSLDYGGKTYNITNQKSILHATFGQSKEDILRGIGLLDLQKQQAEAGENAVIPALITKKYGIKKDSTDLLDMFSQFDENSGISPMVSMIGQLGTEVTSSFNNFINTMKQNINTIVNSSTQARIQYAKNKMGSFQSLFLQGSENFFKTHALNNNKTLGIAATLGLFVAADGLTDNSISDKIFGIPGDIAGEEWDRKMTRSELPRWANIENPQNFDLKTHILYDSVNIQSQRLVRDLGILNKNDYAISVPGINYNMRKKRYSSYVM